MTIKEMREKTGLSQEAFSEKYNIPKRTIENWETGARKPPQYVIDLLEAAMNPPYTTANGMKIPCTNYHVTLDIYLSPTMMDLMYERSIIKKEREVSKSIIEEQLKRCVESFAEVDSIEVTELRNPKYKVDEYYGVDIIDAMKGCPELMDKFDSGEISAIDLKVAYKRKLQKGWQNDN